MQTKKMLRIKQKKSSLDRIVSSSFLALFIVLGLYMYQNMKLVFKMVEYKHTLNKIAELEKNILIVSDNLTEYKKELAINEEKKSDMVKVSSNNFIVRKNIVNSYTVLYETVK